MQSANTTHAAGRRAAAQAGVLLILCVLLYCRHLGAAAAPTGPARCDLTVLVLAAPPEGAPSSPSALVALSYAHLVDHQRLRSSQADLATAAQFQAPGLVRPHSGVLPVGSIIRALPDWRRMRLIFLVGDRFPFRGPHQAAADGFVLRLLNQVAAYEYDVERMSGRIPPAEEASAAPPPAEPLLPAALIGIVTGLAAGWLLGWPLRAATTG